MGLKLFEGGDDDNVEKELLDKIEINEEFARRYEHNKKREDLQKLEEMKKKGVIDDSDDETSSEEEEEEDLNPSSNLKFFDGLIKIKKGDPVLKKKDAKLFESESETDSEVKEKSKKKKPMYLKDVNSKHLMEEGPEFGDDEDEEDERKVKTYSEEQEDLRKEFLIAVEEEDDEDEEDLFKVKENEKRGDLLGDNEEGHTEFAKKLDEFFGEDEKLDEDMVFLKDYFRNEMWRDDKKVKNVEEVEISEDEEEIERQEDYEREFNFRFEENAGDRVWGHSRKVEGSVRKKPNARKLQRERKEERMAEAEEERKEELKRLKNLKKKEIRVKLEKIKETAGIGDDGICLLDVDDLEEEFDPEEYDRKMKKAFGDAYYEADDMDPEFGSDEDEDGGGLEKPDFDKEDELLGLPKGWDNVDEPRDGFLSTREKLLKAMENEDDHEEIADDDKISADDDGVAKEGKRKKKRKQTCSVMKTVKEQLMEEYYKLDYEDTIGDLKTRFKYFPVKANRFGLKPDEMLTMEEKVLNQYVSLKKIAPYREKEWKVPRIKTYQLKKTVEGETSDVPKAEKKRKFVNKEKLNGQTDAKKEKHEESNGDTSKQSRQKRKQQAEHSLSETSDVPKAEKKPKLDNKEKLNGETDAKKEKHEESNGDTRKQSRRSRRRKQQSELKLSEARLKAYSANPSESNRKKK